MATKTITEFVAQLSDGQERAFKAYQALEMMAAVASRPGKNQTERKRVASELAAAVGPQLEAIDKARESHRDQYAEQEFVHPCMKTLRLLSFIAGPAEVLVLAKAIKRLDVREMARFALDRRVCEESTAALIKALDEMGPRFRVGVVNALAKRTDSQPAADVLKGLVGDVDREVVMAAVDGLANFADPTCHAAMTKALKCKCRKTAQHVDKARLRLAETLVKAGKPNPAKRICSAIISSEANDAQKTAAKIILKMAG